MASPLEQALARFRRRQQEAQEAAKPPAGRGSSNHYPDFWREMEQARAAYRPNRLMNFYVERSQGHDDYLMSLALLVEAASALGGRPRTARGRTREEAWS